MSQTFYTPPEVAKLLGIGHKKVLAFIESGELAASDLSLNRNQRPRYTISQQALDNFLALRSTTPAPKPRRRRTKQGQKKEWYAK